MTNTYIGGSVEVRPAVPENVLSEYPFNRLQSDGILFIAPSEDGTYSEIKAASDDQTAHDDQVAAELQDIVDALDDIGYTFSDALHCYNLDDVTSQWRVRVLPSRDVVTEDPQIIYPGDALVLRGSAGPLTTVLTTSLTAAADDVESALETLAKIWFASGTLWFASGPSQSGLAAGGDLTPEQVALADRITTFWTKNPRT